MWLVYHVMVVALLANFGQTAHIPPDVDPPAEIEARIAGGSKTKIDFFPFMAEIVIKRDGHPTVYCGGTIVSRRHVLTSARCILDKNFHQYDPSEVTVKLGTTTTYKKEGGKVFDVEAMYDYRAFNPNSTDQTDVAILALSHPIVYSNTIKPVRLAYQSDIDFVLDLIDHHENCIVLGWGKSHIGASPRITSSGHLKVSLVQLRTLTSCDDSMPETRPNVLCAVSVDGSTRCNGDAGGPLICDYMQIGVVSQNMKKECTESNEPSWFARVDTAYNTILEMMDKTSSSKPKLY